MQSQQIRGALPRAVTLLSSRYPQLLCVFSHFQPCDALRAAKIRARRERSRLSHGLLGVNDGPTRRRILLGSGTARFVAPVFIDSKPHCGLRHRK